MPSYEYLNTPLVAIALFVAFWLTMAAIGYLALKLKDDGGRFRISTLLAITACLAILCAWLKLMLIVK